MTTINDLLKKYDLSKTKLSMLYGIPYKTIMNWTTEGKEHRNCPEWVITVLGKALSADFPESK